MQVLYRILVVPIECKLSSTQIQAVRPSLIFSAGAEYDKVFNFTYSRWSKPSQIRYPKNQLGQWLPR